MSEVDEGVNELVDEVRERIDIELAKMSKLELISLITSGELGFWLPDLRTIRRYRLKCADDEDRAEHDLERDDEDQ